MELLTWKPDEAHVNCWALQEVKLQSKDAALATGLAAARGRNLVLGPPVKSSAEHGGVAVATDAAYRTEQKWAYADGAAGRLRDSGRFVHALVHLSRSQAINVCSLYEHCGDKSEAVRLREKLVTDALEYATALGDIPTVILGDFNTSTTAGGALSAALDTEVWVDVAARFGHTNATCRQGAGSRIDFAIANRPLAGMVTGVRTPQDAPVFPHLPVLIDLDVAAGDAWAWAYRKPREIPASEHSGPVTERVERLRTERAQQAADAVRRAWSGTSIDEMWGLVCDACESFLMAEAEVDDTTYRGRGRTPELERRERASPRAKDEVAASDAVQRRRKECAIGIRHLLRGSSTLLGPGCSPTALQNKWRKIRGNLLRLWPDADLAEMLPDEELLRQWNARLCTEIATAEGRARDARISAWRDRLKRASLAGEHRPVIDWCKDSARSGITHLRGVDGGTTSDPQEIDALLRAQDAWGGVFARYAEREEPDWLDFAARYRSRFPGRVTCTHGELEGEDLCETAARMSSRKASGTDGWRVHELKELPLPLWQIMAEVLQRVERDGTWPKALTQASVAMIPKGSSDAAPLPLALRPISIMSVVYRIWAATRLKQLRRWQEGWCSRYQHGFRPNHGCEDVLWQFGLLTEEACLRGEPDGAFTVHYDFAKCFDTIPHTITLALAAELGMPEGIGRALAGMYRDLERRFRIPGGVGEAFRATNGILQGCPLSVVLVNVLLVVWVRELGSLNIPGAAIGVYADDVSVKAASPLGIAGSGRA
eukprot:Rhum_TRINITY_DN15269_c1_g2::Rhum_TRINITY_DN15269_c1_g2_i1::g.147151::m.147151